MHAILVKKVQKIPRRRNSSQFTKFEGVTHKSYWWVILLSAGISLHEIEKKIYWDSCVIRCHFTWVRIKKPLMENPSRFFAKRNSVGYYARI